MRSRIVSFVHGSHDRAAAESGWPPPAQPGAYRAAGRRALIIDRRAVVGTELCRSLARRGYTADVAAELTSPAFYSRFCGRRLVTPPLSSGEAFLARIRRIIRTSPYDAIFVCNEEILAALIRLPETAALAGLLRPARKSLETALGKHAMYRLAAVSGVLTPRTFFPNDERELDRVARELEFPMLVKGDRGEAGERVRLVHNRRELLGAWREVMALEWTNGTSPALQEFVPGACYSVGGLFKDGQPLRVCAHRKLVAVPPLGGLTVRGVTERPAGLLDAAFRIFELLGYSGLGHVDLICDGSGRYNFLEINPRVWGTIGVGEYAGVDFFTPYFDLVRGVAVNPDLHFREGVRFRRLMREAKMIRRRPSRIFGFLRDSVDPAVRSDFSLLDPGPHIAACITQGLGIPVPLRRRRAGRAARAAMGT
jgi:predicted ATP-grasp superfamily ATP-dependent carboligase